MQTTLARLGRRYAQVGQAWWHPPALPHGGRGSGAPISWCQLWHGSATACPAGIEAGGSRAHCLNGGSKFFFGYVQIVLYLSRVAARQTIGHLVHEVLQQARPNSSVDRNAPRAARRDVHAAGLPAEPTLCP